MTKLQMLNPWTAYTDFYDHVYVETVNIMRIVIHDIIRNYDRDSYIFRNGFNQTRSNC